MDRNGTEAAVMGRREERGMEEKEGREGRRKGRKEGKESSDNRCWTLTGKERRGEGIEDNSDGGCCPCIEERERKRGKRVAAKHLWTEGRKKR